MWLSTATSPHAKLVAGLNLEGASSNSSPNRKKPKNAADETAQYTVLSGFVDVSNDWWMAPNIDTVMGRRIRGGEPLSTLARLMPAWTLLRIGSDDCSLGSGKPREICMFLSAER